MVLCSSVIMPLSSMKAKAIQNLINFEEFEYRQTKGDLESLNDAQECPSPANV